MYCLRVSERAG